MTYEESIENCRNAAVQYGLKSVEYYHAQQEMLILGKAEMKQHKFINFLNKIAWLLKRKK